MIKLITWFVSKGVLFLDKRNIDVWSLLESDKSKKIRQLNNEFHNIKHQSYQKRLEMIEAYDRFLMEIQDKYLVMLGETKNPALQATMTQHWFSAAADIVKIHNQHLVLVSQLETMQQEMVNLEKV